MGRGGSTSSLLPRPLAYVIRLEGLRGRRELASSLGSSSCRSLSSITSTWEMEMEMEQKKEEHEKIKDKRKKRKPEEKLKVQNKNKN